ncbi:LOW QUALITY PROTEIN: uncharacterized protein LOC108099025 [Drosophila ficusphila]|uniref:LOW QUALITY PROTEIN: uncharacterized protein LOC108099025 n=1 Tax=Drosophila ficusphila TaxID=30025 RepID=UPI0007E8131B|nr:LOW QUALITY PROTEIN: uncharacterized protein LOC108099025 [Drosophila ficusphila]
MLRGLLVLLLVAGSQVEAATHVNISIAQQPATNPADVKYLEGSAPAELRAGPQKDGDQQFQRIQERQQQVQTQAQQQQQQQQQIGMQAQQQQVPQQLTPRQGLGLQPPPQSQPPMSKNGRLPRRRNHNRRPSVHQQPPMAHSGQFRQRNQQLRQNQEFERYIQSYHSHGPTVETVYESSNPTPQRYTQSSSGVSASSDDGAPQKLVHIDSHRSQQLRMFERQVAAPVSSQVQQVQSANVEAAQDSKPIYEPPQAPIQTASIAPAVSSSSSSSGGSSSSSSSAPAPAAPSLPADPSSGYDSASGFNPATSYNRPSYDPNGFSYEDAQEVDYQDQYPPEVDDGPGYEDYADPAGSGYQGGSGYLPPAAPRGYSPPQRPLVTKTIQIVQPALKAKKYEVRHPAIQKEFYDIEERVVIKPAGTLVVELEHPVAKIPKGETLLPLGHPHPAVASAYSNNNNNGQIQAQTFANGPEYRPSYDAAPAGKEQQTTTIGSSVTTMPSYDQAPKDEFVESRLQQPQPLGDVTDGGKGSFISAVDSKGNAIKINSKHLSPGMIQRAEPEQDYSRSGQRVYQQRNQQSFGRQPYNEDDDYFSGEYLPNVSAGSVEAKPARLELAGEKEELERPTQIIKHEHKIHLPPSQHNIYLGRSRQTPLKERRLQEVPAQVTEIKPYLRSHAGPTVVYAKSQAPRAYYSQPSRQRVAEELDYSAPYSQMRFSPEGQSSRLVEAPKRQEEEPKEEKQQKQQQNTHIQIQIANDQDKSAVVATTIAPDCDRGQQRSELREHKSQRLVEAPKVSEGSVSATQATPSQSKAQPDVDVSLNGAAGHLKPNERVIAATPAPTDAAATSETFHKRRIVVNHPFQTVREVVEHEPFTNYHQIQVNEPAPPSHYHQAYYQPAAQTHGSLVHFQTSSTHGNLYAPYG